ncbi:lipase [Kaistella jeonii]|uniref:G-D-S-L family lipolytic protein n=1 Tax=Kaistella jeonii TaxID=266749 RepID=A0A0C1FAM4_9FLAO|nr:lipase [Kaistella jeonii]KIA90172.1 G-D-S-L family lipolytic protein [Kaistella jeonii]SFB76765.1 GDSL-like Lipase/Acylhydrolase [Kaistella jeonii]VEI96462.1 GDSL-like Lipase/Acylhydrolase [Kaistella jeonii]
MKKILISTIAVSALLFTVSCKTDFDTDVSSIVVTKGDADFTKFVSLGNSLTSGYRDGALYIDGQNESFPSMMAKQMALAGGGAFKQPLMGDNLGGIKAVGFLDKLELKVVNGSLAPVRNEDPTKIMGTTTLANIFSSGPYQNMGVPGAKSFHLGVAGYGNAAYLPNANPYFIRFASSTTASVIGDAVAQAPTFFSLWIGNNDVLSYATSGGLGVDQTGNTNPASYGGNDISDPGLVATVINGYVTALTAGGAKGVIANIPNVTSIPYFTRVPYNPIPLNSTAAADLNTNFAMLNSALVGLGQPARFATLTAASNNPVLIIDKSLVNIAAYLPAAFAMYGQARHATAGDLVLLTASSVIGKDPLTGLPPQPNSQTITGVTIPLADQYVLTKTETAKVLTATAAYNTAIKAIADAKGLAFVDANAKMVQLSSMSGIQYDGVKYTATFVTGGTFSLDGVHLTGRGYALIANEFLRVINQKYKSTLPMVDINSYSGVKFP